VRIRFCESMDYLNFHQNNWKGISTSLDTGQDEVRRDETRRHLSQLLRISTQLSSTIEFLQPFFIFTKALPFQTLSCSHSLSHHEHLQLQAERDDLTSAEKNGMFLLNIHFHNKLYHFLNNRSVPTDHFRHL
jgi:hypothetical protein